jgi:hypothetical protein
MEPTAKLRFVGKTLQQWWAEFRYGQETPEGEWRDVPVEKETKV